MQGGERRDATTAALMGAALDELLEQGQGDFAMESVARRAFFSVGAVYERWPDKESLLADVAALALPEVIGDLVDEAHTEQMVSALFDEQGGRDAMVLLGECLLAAQFLPGVRDPALAAWQGLQDRLRASMGEGMAWYVGTLALGSALVELMGVAAPSPARGRQQVLTDAVRIEREQTVLPAAPAMAPLEANLPHVPPPSRTDAVAQSLIGAAQLVLAESGAAGATTRDIAATAGVSTGALYRRYEGKSGLLADVLVTQLQPDRYSWTWDLIRAFGQDAPYVAAGDVLADVLLRVSSDRAAQQVLLQIGIAARNDPALRAQVADRIRSAWDARRDMAEHFIQVGVLRDDVAPDVVAWAFQALPVGMRALLPLTDGPDPDQARAGLRAVVAALAARG
ncbi:MAG: TetR family transcriptional regulator [Candidatus Nanopelagicales bacterium]